MSKSFDGFFVANELICVTHWIVNRFLSDLTKISADDDNGLKEDLIEINSCERLQLLFDK